MLNETDTPICVSKHFADKSAPASKRIVTTLVCPQAAALHRGVKLSSFIRFRSAPASTSALAISVNP